MATRKRPPSAKEVLEASRDPRFLAAVNAERYEFWRTEALCLNYSGESFFPTDADPKDRQLQICSVCPVRAQCLAFALKNGDQYGIWGGTTEGERRPMLMAWHRKPGAPLPDEVEEVKPAPKPKPAPSTTCHRGHEKEGRDKNGTPYCLICKAAQVAKLRGRSHVNRPRPVSCGTVVGAEAHYRRKETVCEPCGTAVADVGLQVPA